MPTRPSRLRPASVSDDWHAELPDSQLEVYNFYVPKLEAAYAMLSVALDEALGLHQSRRDQKAYQAVGVTSDLCALLTVPLEDLLRSMLIHVRHSGVVPNAVPLNSENFRGSRGQRTALMSALFSRVLLTQRSQFLHKLSALQELIDDLAKDFAAAAEELSNGAPFEPQKNWDCLDATHFDLNTCFRESIVLFKSFLLALPEGQIKDFHNSVQLQSGSHEPPQGSRQRSLRHRRMTAIAGQ
ncbi:MAG: hypothetical protein PVS2B2_09700 [Candidatus Acidiferrum sp.]